MKSIPAPLRVPPWVVLLAILLVTAVWSVFPLFSPRTPGTLHLGVVAGEDPASLERAFLPLVQFLAPSVRRSGEVRVITAEQARTGEHGVDLLFVVREQPVPEDHEVLAWSKPVGRIGRGSPLVMVTPTGPPVETARWALGDASVLGGPAAARAQLVARGVSLSEDPPVVGVSPYRHDEVIFLLRHHAVDRIVVRGEDVERAKAAGLLDPDGIRVEALDEASARFALVAGPSLSDPARRRLRARALDLDVLRLNPRTGTARAVANAMAELGLAGFAPTEPFPSLRP